MSFKLSFSHLRYSKTKLVDAAMTAGKALLFDNLSLAEASNVMKTEFERPLTKTVTFLSKAMAPTLNDHPASDTKGEKLLLRTLVDPSQRSVYVGDVVAVKVPLETGEKVLVRRLVAQEGDEMISDDSEDEPFRIPRDHCWILGDNEDIPYQEAEDSRTHGPVPYSSIIGRVLYSCRSSTDHGSVENSEDAMEDDQPILEQTFNFPGSTTGARLAYTAFSNSNVTLVEGCTETNHTVGRLFYFIWKESISCGSVCPMQKTVS
ncbi:hypothetical protein CYMTET_7138 [Cymbomonas tetramitiformis]|uniref:Mitochondrial inner membrane protease subunit 2 n=1 Tax=Cymbomonas tetramitiformis TaxID=36881 RepID=A0AAE0GW26_9CHLO|nr:hypothetical protein CYMTET_7138 [Cymbomonas tetramitiformis]